jgi:hypothetical protein
VVRVHWPGRTTAVRSKQQPGGEQEASTQMNANGRG